MNEIVNKFLLMGDKFMPEMHLKQPGFTYTACDPFTKNKERIESLCRLEIQILFINMNLIRLVFNMIWLMVKTKDLVKRTQSDKVLKAKAKDKAFKVTSDPEYDGYQRGLASTVHMFFDKKSVSLNKSSGSGIANEPSYQVANEFHKSIIRKFKKRKVYLSFRENIWGVNLADMQSLSKYNKGIKYLLCAIDLFSKYAWVAPLKDKIGITIVNTFRKIISKG